MIGSPSKLVLYSSKVSIEDKYFLSAAVHDSGAQLIQKGQKDVYTALLLHLSDDLINQN